MCGRMEWAQVGAQGAHTPGGWAYQLPRHRLSLCPLWLGSRAHGPTEWHLGVGRRQGPIPPGKACGDHMLVFQYKVLSVLPGSGMGIAVTTPSTQKVSAGQAGPPGPVQSH